MIIEIITEAFVYLKLTFTGPAVLLNSLHTQFLYHELEISDSQELEWVKVHGVEMEKFLRDAPSRSKWSMLERRHLVVNRHYREHEPSESSLCDFSRDPNGKYETSCVHGKTSSNMAAYLFVRVLYVLFMTCRINCSEEIDIDSRGSAYISLL